MYVSDSSAIHLRLLLAFTSASVNHTKPILSCQSVEWEGDRRTSEYLHPILDQKQRTATITTNTTIHNCSTHAPPYTTPQPTRHHGRNSSSHHATHHRRNYHKPHGRRKGSGHAVRHGPPVPRGFAAREHRSHTVSRNGMYPQTCHAVGEIWTAGANCSYVKLDVIPFVR